MDKDYVLSEIKLAVDHLTVLHKDLTNSDWKFNTEKVAKDIGNATDKGRSGLSILVNSIPSMEYRLNKYRESGDIEDLNHFMEMANKYYDAISKIRDSFNLLDQICIKLKEINYESSEQHT